MTDHSADAGKMATTDPRYYVARGGDDEPGLILIIDHYDGIVVARSANLVLNKVEQLVMLANKGLESVGRE